MQLAVPAPTPERTSSPWGMLADVFSCRTFDPEAAAAVAVAHLGGRPVRVRQR
jgi:hypothetical protein